MNTLRLGVTDNEFLEELAVEAKVFIGLESVVTEVMERSIQFRPRLTAARALLETEKEGLFDKLRKASLKRSRGHTPSSGGHNGNGFTELSRAPSSGPQQV